MGDKPMKDFLIILTFFTFIILCVALYIIFAIRSVNSETSQLTDERHRIVMDETGGILATFYHGIQKSPGGQVMVKFGPWSKSIEIKTGDQK